mmetsp:Transcript_82455/g.231274  ORF Transcript_82455/g.231274 Transcript_82455/m.231274 type:complete len:211 (+) Transcript_82455:63-695(+)
MLAGDPANQMEWHEAHRDLAKNMYRTSYSDMSHSRETYVRSDFPAGYGGHVPSVRFDVLHRNTAVDRQMALRRFDPSRDAHPSFQMQLDGLPSVTAFPSGAKKNPTRGVVPHSGWTTSPKPPWGIMTGKPLNQRTVPQTLRRNASAPTLASAGVHLAASAAAARQAPRAMLAQESPTAARMRSTVELANCEAGRGCMPTEAEMLAAEQMY